ncbi:DUF4097 family beta strand repeat-containing protein [Micromonospora sp. BRA006-A]|nr:DUF4097 family beta strand repeat-containing protein [Micromonospora sp. BRA006-A]
MSVAVPPDVLATPSVVSGALVASGLRRETRVDVTSGQVTLRGLRGRTSAKVISGPVEALGIGGDLDLETVSGELILADSAPDRVRAHAVSGSITCDLDNPRGSEIRLSAISGSITVRVREDSDSPCTCTPRPARSPAASPGGQRWTRARLDQGQPRRARRGCW